MNMFLWITDSCIPHYEATIRHRDKDFMNSDIRHKMNVRYRLWKQYKETNTDESFHKFKEMINQVCAIRYSKFKNQTKNTEHISTIEVGSKK